jgi:hypothetical protein
MSVAAPATYLTQAQLYQQIKNPSQFPVYILAIKMSQMKLTHVQTQDSILQTGVSQTYLLTHNLNQQGGELCQSCALG